MVPPVGPAGLEPATSWSQTTRATKLRYGPCAHEVYPSATSRTGPVSLVYAGRTMKTSVSEVGPNKVRVSVEIPADRVAELLAKTYKRLAGEVRIPGFRPGKAPRQLIDQRLGKDFVRNEALRAALPDWYAEAVGASELDVVSAPEIDVKTFEDGSDLAFDAVVEIKPEPVLSDYTRLAVVRPITDVSEEEVDEQIGHLRTRFASLEVVERPVQEGDFASIDLTTYRHDEVVDEATAKDLLVEVGGEMIVPELDAELEGKRKGDILKFTCTLPERFGERAGWQVGMQVLVKEVKTRRLPALDDDFATTVSEFDTLEELRGDIRSRMEQGKEQQAEGAVRERALEAFVEKAVELDVPDGMLSLETDGLVENFVRILAAQGVDVQKYMEREQMDVDGLRDRMRPQAERNIKARLGLAAVGAAEGLEVTDEDRETEVERLAERTQRPPDEVREAIEESDGWSSVDGDIIRAKALDLLVERAEITTEEASE